MKYVLRSSAVAFFAVFASQSASAADFTLKFENILVSHPSPATPFINDFYNGGFSSAGTSGPNYGVSFSPNAQAFCLNGLGENCSNVSRGGLGDPESQFGGLIWNTGQSVTLNVEGGFRNHVSFYFRTGNASGSVGIFSGLDGTGELLAFRGLPTNLGGDCPGYSAALCPFAFVDLAFGGGAAKSVVFTGSPDELALDDISFYEATLPIPEPSTWALLLAGLFLTGAAMRQAPRVSYQRA